MEIAFFILVLCSILDIQGRLTTSRRDALNAGQQARRRYPLNVGQLRKREAVNGKNVDLNLVKVGCYEQYSIPELKPSHLNSPVLNKRINIKWEEHGINSFVKNLLRLCKEATERKGFKLFAIVFWGECWGIKDDDSLKNAKSSANCKTVNYGLCDASNNVECVGIDKTAFVYTTKAETAFAPHQGPPKCKLVADVVFVLDSSGSVKGHYPREKELLKSLAQAFGISKDGTHAAVISFSTAAKLSIRMNQYDKQDVFNAAVDSIPLLKRYTRIDLALKLAWTQIFNRAGGTRPNVPRVLILITDGIQTGAVDPSTLAKQMRRSGIVIIVIGIGRGVDRKQLSSISGEQKWHTARNWASLQDIGFVNQLTKSVCKDLVHPCDKKDKGGCAHQCIKDGTKFECACNPGFLLAQDGKSCGPSKCKLVADVVFAMDSSGSIRRHYPKEKELLESLAQAFGISKDGAHAAVVTFSTLAKLSIMMNQYDTENTFNAAVDSIPLFRHYTRIDRALELAWTQIFNKAHGTRKNVPRVLILITDGMQTNSTGSTDPSTIAERMRRSGVETIAIGLGRSINRRELAKISGGDKCYIATTWSSVRSRRLINELTNTVCKDAGIDHQQGKGLCTHVY